METKRMWSRMAVVIWPFYHAVSGEQRWRGDGGWLNQLCSDCGWPGRWVLWKACQDEMMTTSGISNSATWTTTIIIIMLPLMMLLTNAKRLITIHKTTDTINLAFHPDTCQSVIRIKWSLLMLKLGSPDASGTTCPAVSFQLESASVEKSPGEIGMSFAPSLEIKERYPSSLRRLGVKFMVTTLGPSPPWARDGLLWRLASDLWVWKGLTSEFYNPLEWATISGGRDRTKKNGSFNDSKQALDWIPLGSSKCLVWCRHECTQ